METDPVASRLLLAAGVGLFPYSQNNVHGDKAFELIFRGYNKNMELQSKIVSLNVMVALGASLGSRLDTSKVVQRLSLIKHEIDKAMFGSEAAGEAPEVAADADALYKKAFGDVDHNKLAEAYNAWNKKK